MHLFSPDPFSGLQARDLRLIAASFVSALPLAFWVWVIYDIVRGNAA